jgi:hypothetical protein
MQREEKPIMFPLGAEGPFHRLQVRLRLMNEERPRAGRCILAAVGVTWLPMAFLWWWQPGEPGIEIDGAASSLFRHVATYARFFVTLPLLIVADNAVRPDLEHALEHALNSGMVPPSQQPQFLDVLARALEWRKSRIAEAAILGLAFLMAQIAIAVTVSGRHASWIHVGGSLTWAGAWYAYVSLPVLQFLVFRWLYRILIWWRVMHGLASLHLEILPSHPDRRGGLAFVGDSVQAFTSLALAFSATAAGAAADYILSEGASITELKGFVAGACVFILSLFVAPLCFFFRPAYRAKDEALLHYEGLAERFCLDFERKWIHSPPSSVASDRFAQPDISALADLATIVKTVREMKVVPVTAEGALPLIVAIVVPFLPVLAVAVPLEELLAGILHVFMGRVE